MKTVEFLIFFTIFTGFAVIFLGPAALWVLPVGFIVTYICMTIYFTWISPPKDFIKASNNSNDNG